MSTTTAIESLPPVRLRNMDRDALSAYVENTWQLYELLFESITGEGALYRNPDPLRHPLIFYLGHTASFYVNKLRMAGLLDRPMNRRFEELFAVGVDPASADELDTAIDWPSERELREFRREVHDAVADVVRTVELPAEPSWDDPLWSLLMGIEHDRIHFETSSVLIRQYSPADVTRPAGWRYAPTSGNPPDNRFLPCSGGPVVLGRDDDADLYGWDNEYGRREVEVAPFEASRTLVTNAEFLRFVDDGGYADASLWDAAGTSWLRKSGAACPRFWLRDGSDGGYRYRAMFDELELPLDWPVEVNAHEAHAYCRWLGEGARLPTEAEYRALAAGAPLTGGEPAFSDGFNVNLRYGSPSPVGLLDRGRTVEGFDDVYGNVWHWLADDFAPLPGFRIHPHYEDYSAPFFDEHHAVMLGGSWASMGTILSRSCRSWFRRGFVQHAGFRLARDAG